MRRCQYRGGAGGGGGLPGDPFAAANFAALEIPKGPSVIRPSDCNKSHQTCARQRPAAGSAAPDVMPLRKKRLARARSGARLALLRGHNACSCGEGWNCSRQNFATENFRHPFLTAKFSRRNPPPSQCDVPSGCCFFTGPWTVTRSFVTA